MDKALEKINKLLKQKEVWKKRLNQIKLEYKNALKEEKILNSEMEQLLNNNTDLFIKEKDIFTKKQKINEKERKSKKRFWAMFSLFNVLIVVLIIMLAKLILSLFLLVGVNLLIIPGLLVVSGLEGCKLEKEYLEKNKIEDIQELIDENSKKINIQKTKINTNNEKLKKLKCDKLEMQNIINILEERIQEIISLRQITIDNYINENLELDNLINNNFLEYENKNRLVKKK